MASVSETETRVKTDTDRRRESRDRGERRLGESIEWSSNGPRLLRALRRPENLSDQFGRRTSIDTQTTLTLVDPQEPSMKYLLKLWRYMSTPVLQKETNKLSVRQTHGSECSEETDFLPIGQTLK
uniref:Uncharacterized protein n=1 Tax=Steinernema glaseri TaxID=37863 RepID=A0A1I7Y7J9_9BILA